MGTTVNTSLTCVENAYTDNVNKDTNYGNASPLLISSPEQTWLKFNKSSLPSNAIILKAELEINMTVLFEDTLRIESGEASWDENVLTFNNKPTLDHYIFTGNNFFSASGVKKIDIQLSDKVNDYATIILSTFSANSFSITNRTSGTPPKLNLTYYVPDGDIIEDIDANYTSSFNPDTVYQGEYLYTGAGRVAFVKFENYDLTNKRVKELNIILYNLGTLAGSSIILDTRLLEASWNPFTLTYSNMPNFTFDESRVLPDNNLYIRNVIPLNVNGFNKINDYGLVLTGSTFSYSSKTKGFNAYLEIVTEDTPPTPPTILNPLTGQIIDKDEPLTVSWDILNQDNFEVDTSTDGLIWSTVAGTTAKEYIYPASTFSVGDLYIRVRTQYDSVWTDYSEVQLITVAEKPPAPTNITSGTITTALPLITWTASNLVSFTLNLFDSLGALVETGTGGTSSYQVVNPLSDVETYTTKITYTDTNGLTSPEGQSTITTAFITPTKPTLTLVDNGYYITGTIDNIDATAIYNDIYKLVDGVWIRVRKELPLNDVFNDFNLRSDVEYQYKVRAFGAGLGYIESDIEVVTISFLDVYLTTINQGLQLKWNPTITKSTVVERKLMKFAGREQRVAEYGDGTSIDFSILSFRIKTEEELETLESMIKERGTILYRDMRGIMVNLSIQGISATHDTIGYNVTFVNANDILVSEVV